MTVLTLHHSVQVDQREGEVAVYSPELGGGSVLRGLAALRFSSLHTRFGSGSFTAELAVQDTDAGDSSGWQGFLDALLSRGILVRGPAPRLDTTPVPLRVRLAGPLTELLSGCLDAADTIAIGSHDVQVEVFLTDRFDLAEVLSFNEKACMTETQSVVGRVYGDTVEVGPWVVPGRTPCFRCYWARLQAGREQAPPEAFLRDNGKPVSVDPRSSLIAGTAANLVARELLKAAAGEPPVSMAQVIQLNLATMTLVKHKVLPVPNCPTCAAVR